MSQRWNDLLYAHWPVPPAQIEALLPIGLRVDTFQGSAWLGVVPFWLERIKYRGAEFLPGPHGFPDLNLRTYVRDQQSGTPGMYFFSLDAGSLSAVASARLFFHLPYHWAKMRMEQHEEREIAFTSRRRLSARPVVFEARYRSLGPSARLAEYKPNSLEHFLMERYCLFTADRTGHPVRSNLHPVPSPLEEAEAEIGTNQLAEAIGVPLPSQPPVLHYSRRLTVYLWPAQRLRQALSGQVAVAVSPST
jgi:uncharacterized protein YqjF (DUF2071 family)